MLAVNDSNLSQISSRPRSNKQGSVKCSCHVPFQQSQHSEQSWRRADTKENVNGNHEITTQKQKRKHFLLHRDMNYCPLYQAASVLPLSYAEISICLFMYSFNVNYLDLTLMYIRHEKYILYIIYCIPQI